MKGMQKQAILLLKKIMFYAKCWLVSPWHKEHAGNKAFLSANMLIKNIELKISRLAD